MASVAGTASADTITIAPGQAIQWAINLASPGDTVVLNPGVYYTNGVRVTKAITLLGRPGAQLQAITPGTGTGVTISADGCRVEGLFLNSFNMAIAPENLAPRNNVTIINNRTYCSQYHLWVVGANWFVERNDFNRVYWWNGEGDADYTRMFGSGHLFRQNYLHGTNFSNDDLAPSSGSDYAHVDGIQYYGNNGEKLLGCWIVRNFFTDFHQGLFLCDESPGSLQNLIIRNNVFWGQSYTPPAGSDNLYGLPSWGICIGKNVGGTGMIVQNNFLYNVANFFGIRAGSSGHWIKNIVIGNNRGTMYDPSTWVPSDVTVDNVVYGCASVGQTGYDGADKATSPQMANASRPLGGDGIPMTADDGWRPTNPDAAGYGPLFVLGGAWLKP